MPKPPMWSSPPIVADIECPDVGAIRLTLSIHIDSCGPVPATDGSLLLEAGGALLTEAGNTLALE